MMGVTAEDPIEGLQITIETHRFCRKLPRTSGSAWQGTLENASCCSPGRGAFVKRSRACVRRLQRIQPTCPKQLKKAGGAKKSTFFCPTARSSRIRGYAGLGSRRLWSHLSRPGQVPNPTFQVCVQWKGGRPPKQSRSPERTFTILH